jgi:hypothetical protein
MIDTASITISQYLRDSWTPPAVDNPADTPDVPLGQSAEGQVAASDSTGVENRQNSLSLLAVEGYDTAQRELYRAIGEYASSTEQKALRAPLDGASSAPTEGGGVAAACGAQPSSAQPAAIEPGTPDYYQQRYDDFVARNPCAQPPDYYLEYGEKYADRFDSLNDSDLSPEGLAWRTKTLEALQQAIEDERIADPAKFAALERDSKEFRRFAFKTHPEAYVHSGLYDLPVQDLLVIALTPDINDVLSQEGILQTLITIGKLKPNDMLDILHSTGEQYVNDNGLLAFLPLAGPRLEFMTQGQRMWDRVTGQSWMPSWAPWIVAPLPTLDNALPDIDLPKPFPKDVPLVPFL